ncbi:c-type cytochrome domain-containing protein [Singulisphaera sp. Ch08]|uniref:C-type cytochrome domain-containing protein n=1 Tax=Singulisphaera sp. Ch08 TaxID=3120278 RepID=A0AAU7CD47_9BACT
MSEPTDPDSTPKTGETPTAPEKDGLKFSRDIAPILVGNCIGCHNEKAMAKNGKLDLTTFEKLKKGGAGGAGFVAGMPEESHLYLRLTGDETPRMPRNANRQLSEAAIEKVGAWVKAGAIFDGTDPKALLTSYAATPEQLRTAELAKLSVADRDKLVEAKGLERWKKGNAKDTPQVTPGKNFMLFGVLPKERVNSTLKLADAQYPKIIGLISPSGSREPLEKIGLYVFNERSHFVEFVRSNENREVDKLEQGTANLGDAEPYIAVVDPLGGRDEPASPARRTGRSKKKSRDDSTDADRSLGGLITDYIATGVVKRESEKAPVWLSLGLGSFFGSRVDPRSPNTQQLRRAAFEQFELGWTNRANDALGGEGKPESVRAIGFGIIEALAMGPQTRAALPQFVKDLLENPAKLDDILKDTLGTDRAQFLAGTGEFVATQYGRSR